MVNKWHFSFYLTQFELETKFQQILKSYFDQKHTL
ncbi:unnamed protein product, partial [Brassica rapa]